MTKNDKTRGWLGDHPRVESMGRAAALNDFFALPVRYPDPGRWIEAESLFQDDDGRLRNMIVGYGQARWGTDNPHLAGSGFIVKNNIRLQD